MTRLVRVAADHGRKTGGHGIEVVEVVQDVDEATGDLDHLVSGQSRRPGAPIVVAAHGRDRGDVVQCREYRLVADVARVQDARTAGQGCERRRAHQTVRIRDQTDA